MNLMKNTRKKVIMNAQVIEFIESQGLRLDVLPNMRIFSEVQSSQHPLNSLKIIRPRDYTDGERIIISGRKKYLLSETHFSGMHNAMNILSV